MIHRVKLSGITAILKWSNWSHEDGRVYFWTIRMKGLMFVFSNAQWDNPSNHSYQMTKAKRVYWEAFRGSDKLCWHRSEHTEGEVRSGPNSLHLGKKRDGSILLLCSHSPNDGPPPPSPHGTSAERIHTCGTGAVRPSKMFLYLSFEMLSKDRGVARPDTLLKQTYFEK